MSNLRDYYLSQFPSGLRGERHNPDSVVYALDMARLEAIQDWQNTILTMGDQFQIRTATIALTDWETFLKIPTDSTLTYGERRARILAKISGQAATIANIKTIAKEITGITITIYEYGRPGSVYYDPANHPWKVKIVVDKNLPGAKSFKKAYFETIMKQIFPAHTEFGSDSFVYIAKESFLSPVTGIHDPLILNQEFLQISTI